MKVWRLPGSLPLRAKLTITLVGGALVLIGASTYLSFRYWTEEALAVAEQQALLAAGAVRAPIESALVAGQLPEARRSLRRLVERGAINHARVFAPGGRVVLSSAAEEEGMRERARWLPPSDLLPPDGLVRHDAANQLVEAYLPLSAPGTAFLQVTFPLGPLRTAMDRGLRLGIALVLLSLLAMAALFFAMIEREVVTPVREMTDLLAGERPGAGRGADEIRALGVSVAELVRRDREVEELSETRRRQIAAQAGLAEVGQMATEMAHEFKRPLASLRTALELMDQEYALDPRGEELMGSVRGQLDKLNETMRDLFALARPIEFERETVDLLEVMDGSLLQITGHPAATGIALIRDYEPVPAVYGDAHRIEQVVLNLMLNAAEAMTPPGTLTVRLRPVGDRVRLEVEDTGVGIPPDAREMVLRPFYSTKPTGTGLGLTLVARIVAAHQGSITIESEPGHGTRVRVELPAARLEDGSVSEDEWRTHASL